jgi:hypothetical protein
MNCLSTDDWRFRSKIGQWFAELGEVSALIRFSAAAGSKSFEFFSTMPAFLSFLAKLEPRTSVIAFGTRQLPLRGRVDESFMKAALTVIPENSEYLIVQSAPQASRGYGYSVFISGEGLTELSADLARFAGEEVAVGVYPLWEFDSDHVISAIVPDPDGSVVIGIY